MNNKLIIAAAGAGKTTYLVEEALKDNDKEILIISYTINNVQGIKDKFYELNGCIPSNITIQTWFSFLIEHTIKPYQMSLFSEKISRLLLRNKQSAPFTKGEEIRHYFTKEMMLYSDKISKLAYKLITVSHGKVIERLGNIFEHIFIDEVQDLAGYDLEIIRSIAAKINKLILVGDPRQVTYLTHQPTKNKQYKNGLIEKFIIEKCDNLSFTIDKETLSHSYRSNQIICDYSNLLYPEYSACNSKQKEETEHDGIFLVDYTDKEKYLSKYKPTQLRWNTRTNNIDPNYEVFNFGDSKGITRDRILIYPTNPMLKWIKDSSFTLSDEAKAKLYVAITRAKYSVGILCDISEFSNTDLIPFNTNNNDTIIN